MYKKTLILALAVCLKISGAFGQSADLAIIVGKNTTMDNVTSEELTKIFRAEKAKNPDGVKFILTTRSIGSPERAAALSQIYNMEESDYSKYFLQATFVGMVQSAPRTMASSDALLNFVSSTPGAIGYVRASEANDSVKILKVDGVAPGDAGYKLKIK